MIFRSLRMPLMAAAMLAFSASAAQASGDLAIAKKEGKVVWYSSLSLPIAQEMCNLFNDKKMGFECVLHRSGSGKLFKRYIQEAKSNIFTADVFHTSNLGHFVSLKKQDLIIEYVPKGADKFPDAFKDKDGRWHVLRAFAYVIAVNTTKVSPADEPKSWKDLLDPKWKGRMVNAHPSYSGAVSNGMSALVNKFGWEFMDKLAAQKPRVVQSAVDTDGYLVRGEADISSGSGTYNSFGHIKKGEPIKVIVPEEGAPLIRSAQAILKSAPHPHAAKIFSDWLFSVEAQQVLANRGLFVGHPDVKAPKGQMSMKDLKILPLEPDEAAKMRKPLRKRFREQFGV
ncbi:MAG: iron(III) transport system substrate-binding protein [Gammaproteobacteria bacterium]|jgi:iron(III) transport system substrate-binding protein